jgi:hypothetical protein
MRKIFLLNDDSKYKKGKGIKINKVKFVLIFVFKIDRLLFLFFLRYYIKFRKIKIIKL